jgi:hypothetical protein
LHTSETAIFERIRTLHTLLAAGNTQQTAGSTQIGNARVQVATEQGRGVDVSDASSSVEHVDPLDYSLPLTIDDALTPKPDNLHIVNELPRGKVFPISYYAGYAPQAEWQCAEINHIPNEVTPMPITYLLPKPSKLMSAHVHRRSLCATMVL